MKEEQIERTISTCINDILEENQRTVAWSKETHVINGLGFSSLDLAQLIARLEMDLAVDPFAEGMDITEIAYVENLYKVYTDALISHGIHHAR